VKVGFIDLGRLDYTPETPLKRPLGGMQSGLSYLTSALAARGHEVLLFNNTTTPGTFKNVSCLNIRSLAAGPSAGLDVLVSISAAGLRLRQAGITCPMLLWTGHDIDQPAVRALCDGNERFVWDKFLLKSKWQAERYSKFFSIKGSNLAILRNAVSPAFEALVRKQYFFEDGRPPTLVYSSTPFRGLRILLGAFPKIRAEVAGCRAKIFSSMAVYQGSDANYKDLFDRCRRTEGMEYSGSVSQTLLAQAFETADIFAYPSVFPETSCIALMEAMAAGCLVVTTDLGALAETVAGYGCLLPPLQQNAQLHQVVETYAQFVIRAVAEARANKNEFRRRLESQRAFVSERYTWAARAIEFETIADQIRGQEPHISPPGRDAACPCRSGKRFEHCCGTMTGIQRHQ